MSERPYLLTDSDVDLLLYALLRLESMSRIGAESDDRPRGYARQCEVRAESAALLKARLIQARQGHVADRLLGEG